MTDNITLPRATVQQALDALERTNSEPGSMAYEREAKASVALEDALRAAPQQQAEPVAWIVDGGKKNGELLHMHEYALELVAPKIMCKPLYTASPQRKPLTDEQADQIISGLQTCHHQSSKREFLKVWLRDWAAHGIKEGT